MQKLISINPANNIVVGEVAISTQEEIINKVKQAHAVKNLWKALGVQKRVAILRPLLIAFKNKELELAELISKEMGKTITEAKDCFTWDYVYLQEFFEKGPTYIEDEITFRNESTLHRIVYEPRGVVASIVPWNFPFSNFYWSVIPNLIVGNTVIFKHSEECPLVGKMLEEIMNNLEGLPKGVFSEVYGSAEVGEMLINQPINMIWFTGSSKIGKKLFALAGKKQIKAVLEMGGSNPTIIFDDVDIDSLIPKLYEERFINSGQVCDAMKRLIVHKSIFNTVVEKLAQHLRQIKIGDPLDEQTQLGPLAALRQLELLEEQVNESVAAGATVITGGARVPGMIGAYYLPTILINIKNDMRVWREEIFGPVLPIVPFDTEEEAIALANDSSYGLGAVIFSKDLARARRVAAQLDVGTVNINEGNHWLPCNPFGGHKDSGMGCEHGRHGFQELCQIKVIAEG